MGSLVKKAKKKLGWGAHLLSGGLLPPVREINKAMGDKTFNQLHPGIAELEDQYDATKAAERAAQDAANAPVIPLPDEEEIKRRQRRSASSRGGGRAAPILTGGDRDTLGG